MAINEQLYLGNLHQKPCEIPACGFAFRITNGKVYIKVTSSILVGKKKVTNLV